MSNTTTNTTPAASQAGPASDPGDIYVAMTDDQRLLADQLLATVDHHDLDMAAALAGAVRPRPRDMDPEEAAMADAVVLVTAGKANLLLRKHQNGTRGSPFELICF